MSQVKDLVDAIDAFIKGSKADGTWNAIKASCIMAGWDNLNGALTPLVGTAPTNFNFVSGDYNRKTGLIGNGSTKYLDSNRNNNADPVNSFHLSIYSAVSWPERNGYYFAGMGGTSIGASSFRSLTGALRAAVRSNPSGVPSRSFSRNPGFMGAVRSNPTQITSRIDNQDQVVSTNSESPTSGNISIFTDSSAPASGVTNVRLAFYSIGESLDLALLDARVTTLMNDIDGAIP